MPRLLLLCEYPTLLGGERSMLSTLDSVADAGYDIVVACPPTETQPGSLAAQLDRRGIARVAFCFEDSGGTRPSQQELRGRLAELIRRVRPDLLHANSLSMSRLSGPVADDLAIPSLGHIRDIVKLSQKAIEDVNRHRRLLAVSGATCDYHVARGLDAAKTHVLHNGVDLDRFRPRQPDGRLHRELGIPPEATLIGNIGQICLRKAQDVLLRAVARLAAPVHVVLIGHRQSDKDETRVMEASLRRMGEQGPLAGRVHLLGTRDDVPEILGELTLLAHAARQEPLGRVLLEASAASVAIVATDVGGTREILPEPWHETLLVPPDDEPALAAAVQRLLDDPALRAELSSQLRHHAQRNFDIRDAGPRLVQHYDAVLGRV